MRTLSAVLPRFSSKRVSSRVIHSILPPTIIIRFKGQSFGIGFVLEPSEAMRSIEKDSRYKQWCYSQYPTGQKTSIRGHIIFKPVGN